MVRMGHTRRLLGLLVLSACRVEAPADLAERLAAPDVGLAAALAPSSDSWSEDGDALVSVGRRSGPVARTPQIGARLPRAASGALEVGVGQSERFRLSLVPEGASESARTLDRGRAVYRDAWPSTDLLLTSSGERLEWFLLLRDESAPREIAWRLGLPAELSEVRSDGSGGLLFAAEGGEARLAMPAPFALDARGTRRAVELVHEADRIVVRLDTEGLSYPILLDPLVQLPWWQQVAPTPGVRNYSAMVYDANRRVTVLFGGALQGVAGFLADTWEWDGLQWRLIATAGPAARGDHMMAYDSTRGCVILFGGRNSAGTVFGDTYERCGAGGWSLRSSSGPSPRHRAGLAFDSARNRTVLFGGQQALGISNETWEWNGSSSSWSLRSPATIPPVSYGHSLAYDTARGVTVMNGGATVMGNACCFAIDDTWEWNGSNWLQVLSTGPVGPLMYDAASQRVMLGGSHHWTGTTWVQVSSNSPGGYMTFDSGRSRGVAYSGSSTWELDGSVWSQIIAGSGNLSNPPARVRHGMAYDSARGRTVVFGGLTGGAFTPLGDTWEWSGSAWSNRGSRTARSYVAMAYDPVRARTIMFGGVESSSSRADTLAWDGSNWSPLAVSGPSARSSHAMVYDSGGSRIVMFGGLGSSGNLGDTWALTAAGWGSVSVTGPSARYDSAMAYDSARNVTVLFGGMDSVQRGDTWELAGNTWSLVSSTGPSARQMHALSFDSNRGRVVLFGGLAGALAQNDTWEWDGNNWSPISVSGPATRWGQAMAYDSQRDRSVMFGYQTWSDTWEYHTRLACQANVDCAPPGQCRSAGVCDVASGLCVYPRLPDGTACDDASLCTQSDSCQLGTCTGANPIVCTPSNSCRSSACAPATGACVETSRPDFLSCNDGDACTRTDFCLSGSCTGNNPVLCTALDQCHDPGVCNSGTGLCSNPVRPDGSGCSDNSACTQVDNCQAGACAGSSPVVCPQPDQCHTQGSCVPATGLCTNPTRPNGTGCDDGLLCFSGETCQAGSCSGFAVSCPAIDACHTAGSCNPGTGLCSAPTQPDGTPCNDLDLCTTGDACQAGACAAGAPTLCTPPDVCHDASCNPANGSCAFSLRPDGAPCEDGDLCTSSDSCVSGACASGASVVCTPLDACHEVGVCVSATGQCSNPIAPDGVACDDSDACTQTDSCASGLCFGADPVICSNVNACNVPGMCLTTTGTCAAPPAPPDEDLDGTPDCNDGCPSDASKIAAGACGCGVADTDTDADGTPNCNDQCPADPAKVAPGVCGCGVPDADPCDDLCPADPDKSAPGVCGCGVADLDSDSDGTFDCDDQCPSDPAKVAPGMCGCGEREQDPCVVTSPDAGEPPPSDAGEPAPSDAGEPSASDSGEPPQMTPPPEMASDSGCGCTTSGAERQSSALWLLLVLIALAGIRTARPAGARGGCGRSG